MESLHNVISGLSYGLVELNGPIRNQTQRNENGDSKFLSFELNEESEFGLKCPLEIVFLATSMTNLVTDS